MKTDLKSGHSIKAYRAVYLQHPSGKHRYFIKSWIQKYAEKQHMYCGKKAK